MNEETADSTDLNQHRLVKTFIVDLIIQMGSAICVGLFGVWIFHLTGTNLGLYTLPADTLTQEIMRASGVMFVFNTLIYWDKANRNMFRSRYQQLCAARFDDTATAERCSKIVMAVLMFDSPLLAILLLSIYGGWSVS